MVAPDSVFTATAMNPPVAGTMKGLGPPAAEYVHVGAVSTEAIVLGQRAEYQRGAFVRTLVLFFHWHRPFTSSSISSLLSVRFVGCVCASRVDPWIELWVLCPVCSFSHHVHDESASVGGAAVFPDVDGLPGA